MSVEPDKTSVDRVGARAREAPWDRVAPVLATIATGVGAIGFVTFVGGAIEWARFGAAGLPQETALSVVPTDDLVVVGARTIVPAVAWGLLACGVYLALQLRDRTDREYRGPEALRRVGHLADQLAKEPNRQIFVAVLVGVFEVWAAVATLKAWHASDTLWTVIFVAVTMGVTYRIARSTDRFPYLALTIFFSLSLFLGGVQYVHASETARLRGAAVVRDNKEAIWGFWVAEDSNRVYLARIDLGTVGTPDFQPRRSRLIGIDRDQVTDISIGPSRSPLLAYKQSKALAHRLCGIQKPRPSKSFLQQCVPRFPHLSPR